MVGGYAFGGPFQHGEEGCSGGVLFPQEEHTAQAQFHIHRFDGFLSLEPKNIGFEIPVLILVLDVLVQDFDIAHSFDVKVLVAHAGYLKGR